MAQIYTWDKRGFEDAYELEIYKLRGCGAAMPRNCKCQTTFITYSRKFFETNAMFHERAKKIVDKLQMPVGSTVMVVGCALGYIMEEFERMGMVPYGFDNSSYINGLKTKEKVRYEIPSVDVLSGKLVADLNKWLGVSSFDYVVTEDVLPSHDSFDTIFSNCDLLLKPEMPKSHVVHIVQENAGSPLTSMSINQWKALNAEHTWVDQNGN